MNMKRFLSIIAVVATTLTSFGAQAGTVSDAHGNIGYDTAAECDAAVQSGTAKFYQPFTHKKPLLRKGEKSVQQATIRDLGPQYAMGACDVGVGRQSGRDGVSRALVGKYIAFSPVMPVNVYLNSKGEAVRTTMAQCDNWFSGNAPRPVEFVNNAATTPVVEPTAEAVSPEVISQPAVTATASPAWLLTPYVFATIGMHSENLHSNGNQPSFYNRGVYDDTAPTFSFPLFSFFLPPLPPLPPPLPSPLALPHTLRDIRLPFAPITPPPPSTLPFLLPLLLPLTVPSVEPSPTCVSCQRSGHTKHLYFWYSSAGVSVSLDAARD